MGESELNDVTSIICTIGDASDEWTGTYCNVGDGLIPNKGGWSFDCEFYAYSILSECSRTP